MYPTCSNLQCHLCLSIIIAVVTVLSRVHIKRSLCCFRFLTSSCFLSTKLSTRAMALANIFNLQFPYALPLGTLCIVALGWALSRARKLHYPPGPPEKSMISGNLGDLPAKFAWNTYISWGAIYGAYCFRLRQVIH